MFVAVLFSSAILIPIMAMESNDMEISKATATAFVYDPIYLEHRTGPGHPESAERLNAIIARLDRSNLSSNLLQIKPNDNVEQWIETIHSNDYMRHVKALCEEGKRFLDTGDTTIGPSSYKAACVAVGGVIAAVDCVMRGEAKNAFCAVRPPGHHASQSKGMGFCIFNNIAIAARYIQKQYSLNRILIVDWDVHHGNGTQDSFYRDPSVLFFSTHQYPFYPGTGGAEEQGEGAGKGDNHQCSLPCQHRRRKNHSRLHRGVKTGGAEIQTRFRSHFGGFRRASGRSAWQPSNNR